jgi:hypothetical protein
MLACFVTVNAEEKARKFLMRSSIVTVFMTSENVVECTGI